MENFWKQFKDNLEERPEPAFDPKDWKAMEKKLDQQPSKPALAGWIRWIPAAILALLLLGNIYQFSRIQQALKQLEFSPQKSVQFDTIIQTKVVYITDTIYQSRNATNPLPHSKYAALANNFNPLNFQFSKTPISLLPTQNQTSHRLGQSFSLPIVPSTEPTNLPGQSIHNVLAELPTWTSELLELKGLKLPEPLPVQEPTLSFRQKLHSLKPQKFHLGLNLGTIYPLSSDFNAEFGFSTGIEGVIPFGKRLQLWINGSFNLFSFESKQIDASLGIPPVEPPSPDFFFTEAVASKAFLQYSAGFRYLIPTKRKLMPFIGLGYGAVSLLPYEVEYEFINPTLQVDWKVDQTVNQDTPISRFAIFQAGVERSLSKYWNWQILVQYQTTGQAQNALSPNLLSIQSGIQYKFK